MKNPFKFGPKKPKTLLTVLGNTTETRFDRVLPGIRKWDDAEDLYFQDSGIGNCSDQQSLLFNFEDIPIPKEGSFWGLNCRVTTPDSTIFFAVQAFRDVKGWRKAVEYGAKYHNLLTADVIDDRFVVSDGRSFNIDECKVEFW